MPLRANPLRAPESSHHFEDSPIESSNNLPYSQPKHGLGSLTDTFTCSLAVNGLFSCLANCSSLLILLHSRFIHPNFLPIQPKSDQIEQILPHPEYISIVSGTIRYYILRWRTYTPKCVFRRGSVSAANTHLLSISQICPGLATFWPFYILRRYRQPPDNSQGLNYIILTCPIQRRCPFTVSTPLSDDLPGIAICRWSVSATLISHPFISNPVCINLLR